MLLHMQCCFVFFFFQAEDGIRDWSVTGVQTCALPIYIEKRMRLDQLPPVDRDARALFVERVLPGALTPDVYAGGAYQPIVSWAGIPVAVDVRTVGAAVEVTCRAPQLEKRIRWDAGGGVTVADG